MSNKKNYSKMYSAEEEKVVLETPVEEVTETPVEVAPEEMPVTKKKATLTKGVVVNCTKLNVRAQMSANAAVLCVIPASTEVNVFANENYPEWEHVVTDSGVEGFCMKKYIAIK